MRVLHVLNELRPSGGEVMLRTSAELWREQGVEGDILATGNDLGNYASALSQAGFRIHHLPFSPSIRFLMQIRRLLSEGKYQVLHIHTERASFWYGLVGLSARDVAVVRTIHNVFAFDGYVRLKRLLQRALLRRAGVRSISVGSTVQENERHQLRNPTMHLPNWVDTDIFIPPTSAARETARAAFDVDQETRLIVTSVGNCNAAKNHVAILRALSELDNDDWLYLHAGEQGPDRTERALAEELGIGDRCRFLGYVSEIVSLLHASDVYAMPSLNEGASIAALEALATGLPCLLATSPGLQDLSETVHQGIVWVSPSPKGVRNGLDSIAELAKQNDPGRRVLMHKEVEQRHGLAAGAGAYLNVYRQALVDSGLPAAADV